MRGNAGHAGGTRRKRRRRRGGKEILLFFPLPYNPTCFFCRLAVIVAKLRAVMCVKVEPCAPNASAARRGCPHESTPVEMLKPHGREGGCGMAGGGGARGGGGSWTLTSRAPLPERLRR